MLEELEHGEDNVDDQRTRASADGSEEEVEECDPPAGPVRLRFVGLGLYAAADVLRGEKLGDYYAI
ncbi:MAG: hypothetical protein P4M11_11250 [Candidatus Pacebacteria bacterium]|nr:hypothetical protein [Candidatus Paceibacterota bacterium]